MDKIIRIVLLIFLSYSSLDVLGQELWINAMPMHYHPSFAGNIEQWRVATSNSLNFSPNRLDNENFFSIDKFLGKLHSGVGIELRYSNGKINYYHYPFEGFKWHSLEGRLILAPKFSFNGKYTLSPSIQASWYNYVHYVKLDYNDVNSTIPETVKYSQDKFFLKFGLLFNSRKFFIGLTYTLPHIPNPDYDLSTVPRYKYQNLDFISGYTFRKSEDAKFSFTPSVFIGERTRKQDEYLFSVPRIYAMNLTFNFKYKNAIAGIDLKRNLMLGYEGKKLRIMLIQKYTRITSVMGSNYKLELLYCADILKIFNRKKRNIN